MKSTLPVCITLFTAFAAGQAAQAAVVRVFDPEQRIITNNDWQIGIFESEFTIRPYFDGMPAAAQLPNSIRLGFSESPLSCVIIGNDLPLFPPEPFQTPAIYAHGGLMLEDQFIDHSSPPFWSNPSYDPDSGGVNPAAIRQNSIDGNFNVDLFNEGDNAYIAYATSDYSMFGYVQIQRDMSRTQWRLIGYAFDPTGAPVLVKNLIPAPTSLAVLLGLASFGARRCR